MKEKYARGIMTVFCISFILINSYFSRAALPQPDHVVILMLENHAYQQIIGNAAAPYINGLISDSKCALFTQSYGLSHPSQPNYIQFFSGSNQGVTSNNLPAGLPFTTPNLGAELLGAAYTFIGYSESLPSVGYTGEVSGAYARKHNPWVNWQGAPTNNIPATLNQPFTAFPTNYNSLPTVSFIAPNQDNDMHNGTDPTRITIGDTWVQNNLNAYIQWAKANNSLLILTFDEDDNVSNQHILTMFIGQMVQGGSYSTVIDHYNILRMIEDMYNLPHAGAAATAATIDYCWSGCSQNSVINASGPLTFCNGGSVTLSAAGGTSWLWNTGATTSSITVSASGNYSVTVSNGSGCTSTSSIVSVVVNSFLYKATLFTESMGNVTVNTTIATHESNNGFDNINFTMSGTGEIRASSPSSGYTGATAAGNIFLTNTSGRSCTIADINTSSLTGIELSFGVFKSTTTSTGSDLLVQISSDGINFTNLSLPALPSGTGTAIWYYRTVSGLITATPNLRIRFLQNGTATQYRIDDVKMTYTMTSPSITASGPTTFCNGGNVQLSSSPAAAYNWTTGATTQLITAVNSGSYFVTQTGSNGCTGISNTIVVTAIPSPAISSFNPSSASTGSTITIFGSNFSGVTSVKFNGVTASYTYVSNTQISATVPSTATSGTISVTTNCGTGISTSSFIVTTTPLTLNLKLFIEGYYTGGGQMKSVLGGSVCDSVTVELHHPVSPYGVYYSTKSVVSVSGNVLINVLSSANSNYYYISVNGKNALKTWSSTTVYHSQNTSYDFTTSASKSYGSQSKNLGDGNFALFSGDVTDDDRIDLADINALKISLKAFTSGYSRYDLTGEFFVDTADFSLLENNATLLTLRP